MEQHGYNASESGECCCGDCCDGAQDRFPEAERMYRRALAMIERLDGPESGNTAAVLHNLGGLLRLQVSGAEAV